MDTPFINHGDQPTDWEDLLNCIAKVVRRMYPSLTSTELIDDALQDTMERMLSYWQFLPSSYLGDKLDFRLALFYGIRFCRTRLGELVADTHGFVSTDEDGELESVDSFRLQDIESIGIHDYDSSEEDADEEALYLLLQDAPTEELREWFAVIAEGESTRQEADRTGVSQSTVSRRRTAHKETVQARAAHLRLQRA